VVLEIVLAGEARAAPPGRPIPQSSTAEKPPLTRMGGFVARAVVLAGKGLGTQLTNERPLAVVGPQMVAERRRASEG